MKFLSMDIGDSKIECLELVMQCPPFDYFESGELCWSSMWLKNWMFILVIHYSPFDCFESGELSGNKYWCQICE